MFYRTENAECRPFAFEARAEGKAHTVKRNFELFVPLDFIAEITQHIPDRGTHLIRYYRRPRAAHRTRARPDGTPLRGRRRGPSVRRHWLK